MRGQTLKYNWIRLKKNFEYRVLKGGVQAGKKNNRLPQQGERPDNNFGRKFFPIEIVALQRAAMLASVLSSLYFPRSAVQYDVVICFWHAQSYYPKASRAHGPSYPEWQVPAVHCSPARYNGPNGSFDLSGHVVS